MQEIVFDEDGVARFRSNKIVTYLLEMGPYDMNSIALQRFSQEDQEQFAQLIGYSVSGAGGLSYMSNDLINAADERVAKIMVENAMD